MALNAQYGAFSIGGVVKLKSGGPEMTIDSFEPAHRLAAAGHVADQQPLVRVMWHSAEGVIQTQAFPLHMLDLGGADAKAAEEKAAADKEASDKAEKDRRDAVEQRRDEDEKKRAAAGSTQGAQKGSGYRSDPAGYMQQAEEQERSGSDNRAQDSVEQRHDLSGGIGGRAVPDQSFGRL